MWPFSMGVTYHTIAYQSQTAAHMIECCTDHHTNRAMIISVILVRPLVVRPSQWRPVALCCPVLPYFTLSCPKLL